jgi:hypothetical protein
MAWKGIQGDQRLFWSNTTDGVNWLAPQFHRDLNTDQGPALADYNGRLYMAWKGIQGDQRLFWSSTSKTAAWGGWESPRFKGAFNTDQGPALAAHAGKLYMAWKGIQGDQRIYWSSTYDGINWSTLRSNGAFNSDQGPALASQNGKLYMVWKGIQGDQRIYWSSTYDGITWEPLHSQSTLNTDKKPALASYIIF